MQLDENTTLTVVVLEYPPHLVLHDPLDDDEARAARGKLTLLPRDPTEGRSPPGDPALGRLDGEDAVEALLEQFLVELADTYDASPDVEAVSGLSVDNQARTRRAA